MSVTYSYPGIYVQELPLSTHTITPSPTSITAFVGYTHPWKTLNFNTAVRLFSFSDYQSNFGGLYSSGYIDNDVAQAVYAFFENGGNYAYVVGLQPEAIGTAISVPFGKAPGQLAFQATLVPDPGAPLVGIQLQALEPADLVPMIATITNLRVSKPTALPLVYDTFDLTLNYGTQVEVYRSLSLVPLQGAVGSLDKVINGVSTLVTVAPMNGNKYGTAFPYAPGNPPSVPKPVTFALPPANLPAGFYTTFDASDFIPVFQANTSLDNVEILNLVLVPGVSDNTIVSAALEFAERKRAFAILDPPQQAVASSSVPIPPQIDQVAVPASQNGALYFPYLMTTDNITGNPIAVAPGGYVAGIYAATDASRGVWKAPAGLATGLLSTTGPVATGVMNDMQQGVLNLNAVNCLRTFTGAGTVVYGARTLVGGQNSAYPQSKYVPVRRMTLFIEQTLVANLKWVVFEPNDEPLWLAIRSSIEAFLLSLYNQQALQGSSPDDAFQVKCDKTTTTNADQMNGVVNIVVSVALLKPAEFVIIKIAQMAGPTS